MQFYGEVILRLARQSQTASAASVSHTRWVSVGLKRVPVGLPEVALDEGLNASGLSGEAVLPARPPPKQ